MFRVLLMIDCSNNFDRNLLRGLVRYSKEQGSWLFYRLPANYNGVMYGDKSILEWAREWRADAIIGQWSDNALDLLKELNIPIVLQNYHHRSTTYSNLTGNYKGTGEMAARFFSQRMFRNFAFFGIRGVVWSDERREGYRIEAEEGGGRFFCFEYDGNRDAIYSGLSRWLHELPKPIALFCCDDTHAQLIAEICKMENINIPGEISLMGVDNDELLCSISDPPISSIELEVEEGGYLLGRLLHRQMTKELEGPFNVVINPVRIELRQSTEKHNIKDPNVLKVVKYIETHHGSEITVESLVSQVPLSRRNLELKFKHILGTSIYQYLLEFRVNRFADLLLATDRTMADIASEAGFSDYDNVFRIFRKFKKCSPQEFRQKRR